MRFDTHRRQSTGQRRWLISEIAARLDISPQSLVASLRSEDAPPPIGKLRNRRTGRDYLQYDPVIVIHWWKQKMVYGISMKATDD